MPQYGFDMKKKEQMEGKRNNKEQTQKAHPTSKFTIVTIHWSLGFATVVSEWEWQWGKFRCLVIFF